MDINIAFVVLHYNVYQDTVNCVQSIINNIDTEKYLIIVVDNFSQNESYKILNKQYRASDKVVVLSTKSNLGFAKGNNIGIDYVRDNYNAKYICCLNNDTLLEQEDFYESIDHIYSRTKAAVIGPCVHVEDGTIQQFTHYLETKEYYVRLLEKFERIRRRNYRDPLLDIIKKNLLNSKFGMFLYHYKRGINDKDYYDKEQKNVVLQGCCLIFTPVFFSRFDGFCPETFLYFEEQILTADILKAGLQNVYTPDINIRHLEGRASYSVFKTNKSKRKMYIDNSIDSLKVLIKHLQ